MPNSDLLLKFFQQVETGERLTQRALADRLKISVGHTNALIKKTIARGYIHPPSNANYQLTPEGCSELSRLMYHSMKNTIEWYNATRKRVQDNLRELKNRGIHLIVFYGAGDVAEVTYGVLDTVDLKLVAVVDDYCADELFFEWTVQPTSRLPKIGYERIVVTTFRSAKAIRDRILQLGVPETHLFFFH